MLKAMVMVILKNAEKCKAVITIYGSSYLGTEYTCIVLVFFFFQFIL